MGSGWNVVAARRTIGKPPLPSCTLLTPGNFRSLGDEYVESATTF